MKAALVALALCVGAPLAFAQEADPSAASGALPAAAPAIQVTPSEVEGPAPDPDAVLLDRLRADIDIARARGDLAEQNARAQEANARIDGNEGRRSMAVPDLIGLYGVGERTTAEFVVGSSVLVARKGDWVTPDWRVERMLSNGVVLQKRASGEHRTVLFGRGSTGGSLTSGTAAARVPAPATYPSAATMAGAGNGSSD